MEESGVAPAQGRDLMEEMGCHSASEAIRGVSNVSLLSHSNGAL